MHLYIDTAKDLREEALINEKNSNDSTIQTLPDHVEEEEAEAETETIIISDQIIDLQSLAINETKVVIIYKYYI